MIVHRSEEATARRRGEAFGRAQAPLVARTLSVYARLFGDVDPPTVGPDVRALPEEREELAGIAAGSRCATRCAPTRATRGRVPPRGRLIALGGADGDDRSVVMDLAAPALRVAFGAPCTAAYEDIELPSAGRVEAGAAR